MKTKEILVIEWLEEKLKEENVRLDSIDRKNNPREYGKQLNRYLEVESYVDYLKNSLSELKALRLEVSDLMKTRGETHFL